MSLYERYELLDLERDDGVKSFEAREIATGRPVKVHLFIHPEAPLQMALLKAIDRLPELERQHIIERGKHEGTPYMVTGSLAPHAGLSEWVQSAKHAASHPAQPKKSTLETAGAWKLPAVPAAPQLTTTPQPIATTQPIAKPLTPPATEFKRDAPSSLNQQFAELFPTAERPMIQMEPPAKAPSLPPSSTRQPGEFTRMFQAPSTSTPAPAPPARPASASPPPPNAPAPQTAPPAAKEPGEFTRMFQAPAMGSVPPQAEAPAPLQGSSSASTPPAKTGPGDFTRFFETPSPSGPLPQDHAVQKPLAPQAPGSSGPNRVGEFTRRFGKDDLPASPPTAAPPPPKEPGEFTRMFQAPVASGPPSPRPPVAQPPPPGRSPAMSPLPVTPPPAPIQSGPGDYTRQFAAPAQLTFGQTAATPSPAPVSTPAPFAPQMPTGPAPVRQKSNLPLILGVVGIVVLAALVIVFFAMRPK